MAHLHLIIKGVRREALAAAKQHGITLFHTRLGRHGEPVEIHAMCGDEYLPQVMQWFNEPPHDAPFPVGTLLHWSEQSRV
jgi:hypothetical protein